MHVEIDDHGFYGGVIDFEYDEVDERIRLVLHPERHRGIRFIEIEIPQPLSADDRQLVRKLANAYNSSLPRGN